MADREARAKKKALMDERMRAKAHSRAAHVESTCSCGPGSSKQAEVDAFWAAFEERKQQCERHFIKVAEVVTLTEAKDHFSALEEIFRKQQLLVENAMPYLSAFDVQQAQTFLTEGITRLNKRKSELAPPKKFQFRSRKKTTPAATRASRQERGRARRADEMEELAKLDAVATESSTLVPPTVCLDTVEELSGYRARTLVKKAGLLSGQDFTLRGLSSCTVYLPDTLSALRVVDLVDCKVHVGPVLSSVFLERCRGCNFSLAAQQMRIHDTASCDFYVLVKSGPIMENCTKLRFAPYNLSYCELESQLESAKLSSADNMWDQVKDFEHPHDRISKNWSVLPEESRTVVTL